MNSNQKYFEQVGAFLDNELKGDELTSFNNELASNPELAKELNYQEQLIEGIKKSRHAELKSRLDSIQIGNGFWSGSVVKIATGVLIISGIGFGIYQVSTPETVIENVAPEIEVLNQDAPEEIPDPIIENEIPQEVESDVSKDSSEETQISESTKVADSEDNSLEYIETPNVPQPEAFEMENPAEEELELPENFLGTEEKPMESKFEVEIITNKRKYPFHYQVDSGRLLMYGDFDEEPYELLEINVNEEKKLYLYFKDQYYEIEESAVEITPLQKVSNKFMINELEKLKNKGS
jgi:hypothetical protein